MARLDPSDIAEKLKLGAIDSRLIDAYYSQCIPAYLDTIGVHWHTGFYHDNGEASSDDQLAMIDFLLERLNSRNPQVIVDVGCGLGAGTCYLQSKTKAQTVGITPVSIQRKMASKIAKDSASPTQFLLGDAQQLPLKDSSIDTVFFMESPCHFPDKLAFFNEVARVLKPGGQLIGEDWVATSKMSEELHKKICLEWAIPKLESINGYASMINAAGLQLTEAQDLRSQCHLAAGFAASEEQRHELQHDVESSNDPMQKLVLQGLITLGRAFENNEFSIGIFSAIKS